MRKRAGVIIYCASENRVLLIYRKKKTEQYWVIPGGGLEAHEGFEEAAKRELKEELGLSDQDLSEFCTISLTDSIEKYYISYVNNCKELKIQGEELQRSDVNNVFEPTWVDISELHAKRILPDELKSVLISFFLLFLKIITTNFYLRCEQIEDLHCWCCSFWKNYISQKFIKTTSYPIF